MGFSVVVASAISLIGLLVSTSLIIATMLPAANTLAHLSQEILDCNLMDEGARIDLILKGVDNTKVIFCLRNLGPKTIFFRRGSYDWNTIIVSYRNGRWRTYIIDNYTILETRVTGTNYTISTGNIICLNPGEEALIEARLPSGAPEIPLNGTITVVFASHYGSKAVIRSVRV